MKKTLALVVSIAFFGASLTFPAFGAVKAGATCSKAGSTSTSSGKKYTCINSGKKLVWSKGVLTVAPIPSLTAQSAFLDAQNCQLNPTVSMTPPFSLGFNRDPRFAPTHGTLNVAVVYLSYLDGTINPNAMKEMTSIQEPRTSAFYAASSFGKFQVQFLDAHKVYTIQKNLLGYNLKDNAPDMSTIFSDAMTAAQSDYDFTKVDALAIVLPDNLPVVDIGPNYGMQVTVGGATITRGFDMTYINPVNHRVIDDGWLIHELGHTLGLTHPYLTSMPGPVYAWDVMQYDNSAAPDLFAWEKYILGWIDDSQVDCLAAPLNQKVQVYLSSSGLSDSSTKLLIYRLSDSQAIVVESRRKSSINPLTSTQEGVLVYKLDVNKGFGQGAITLNYLNAQIAHTKYGDEMYGSLQQGDSVMSDGVTITVLKHANGGDYVSISKS